VDGQWRGSKFGGQRVLPPFFFPIYRGRARGAGNHDDIFVPDVIADEAAGLAGKMKPVEPEKQPHPPRCPGKIERRTPCNRHIALPSSHRGDRVSGTPTMLGMPHSVRRSRVFATEEKSAAGAKSKPRSRRTGYRS